MRRTFVTTLLTRKNLPKDAAVFTALTLTRHHQLVTADSGDYARTFLSSTDKDQWGLKGLATLVEQTPTKAQTISPAIALSAFENAIGRDSWRYPSDTGKEYLNQLEQWGYHLSPVERIAAGHPAPADDDTDPAVDEDTVTAE
ncbi:hypothetical protein [Subtercola vilae]|uniref:Uncharacterized protein n=1 Tax=Subtercola vilae TaxID=2056433 RepID=A0A4T2BCV8_9MICO|nr:hypothetical protein [Subtercola vilae]TIH26666.1 hypothetical protein D4765_18935 [Subtercola vilae]